MLTQRQKQYWMVLGMPEGGIRAGYIRLSDSQLAHVQETLEQETGARIIKAERSPRRHSNAPVIRIPSASH